MRGTLRRPILMACCAFALGVAGAPASGRIVGPDELPECLPGLWRVSLCAGCGHTWILLRNPETGEFHTLGRYGTGFGGEHDCRTGKRVWPAAPDCGVIWDIDRKFHCGVRKDGRVLRSCYVRNPRIFRGTFDGHGHCGVRVNCVTYARDAWHFYSGEWYALPPIATASALERGANRGPR